ncbi:MAG: hypothetical protein HJJLKODD_02773 [Phycisphaerae bacterium]|nr:hypothetical protein [Phycisphaerae bacterium]
MRSSYTFIICSGLLLGLGACSSSIRDGGEQNDNSGMGNLTGGALAEILQTDVDELPDAMPLPTFVESEADGAVTGEPGVDDGGGNTGETVLGPVTTLTLTPNAIKSATNQVIRQIEEASGQAALVVDCTGNFPYRSIQSAIDEATEDNIVVILPSDRCSGGAYFENIDFLDKNITLQSLYPTKAKIVNSTIINGSFNGPVVAIGAATTDSGANLRNDFQDSSDIPQLKGLTITNANGSGIICQGGPVLIERCKIESNIGAELGGGVLVEDGADLTLFHTTIANNSATFGAGLAALPGSSVQMTNCVITKNSAGLSGGAVYGAGAEISIDNCTVTRNSGGESGGGFYFNEASQPAINSSIVWENVSPDANSMVIADADSSVSVSYSAIEGGAANVELLEDGSSGALQWGSGNIISNPKLSGDGVHLQSGSPCIDKGDPMAPTTLSDLDGQQRTNAKRIDIGADELM